MTKRTNIATEKESDSMDLDFSLSQQSNESDEQQEKLRETLEKCLAAEVGKKQSQKEKKFLEVATSQFNLRLEKSSKNLSSAMKKIDGLHATFLLDYAKCEDRIQKKLLELQTVQNDFVEMLKEGLKEDEEANKAAGVVHVKGLSKTRAACIAFEEMMKQLEPPDIESSDEE